jgi:hypothetical protein
LAILLGFEDNRAEKPSKKNIEQVVKMGIRETINKEIKKRTGIDVKNKKDNISELKKINEDNLINILKILEEEVKSKSFKESSQRGKLRGFVPLKDNTIDKYSNRNKLEVPLVRLIGLLKNWTTELNLLSGYNNSSKSGGKFSIDLAKKHKNVLKLAEVKEWKGADTLIFAVIEIITNFMIYLIMREKEKDKDDRWAPKCNKFQIEVIAPAEYYDCQGIDSYKKRSKEIEKNLLKVLQLSKDYNVEHLKFKFSEVFIKDDKNGLIKIMKDRNDLLTNKYLKGKPSKISRKELAEDFGLKIQDRK